VRVVVAAALLAILAASPAAAGSVQAPPLAGTDVATGKRIRLDD
jgi:hypothetical protein